MGPHRSEEGPDQRLFLLRRKLHALCYDGHVDEGSAPLVQSLVDDLIRVTEGYRAQKTQLATCHQELDDAYAQVSIIQSITLSCIADLFAAFKRIPVCQLYILRRQGNGANEYVEIILQYDPLLQVTTQRHRHNF